jgi:hypothetical protein
MAAAVAASGGMVSAAIVMPSGAVAVMAGSASAGAAAADVTAVAAGSGAGPAVGAHARAAMAAPLLPVNVLPRPSSLIVLVDYQAAMARPAAAVGAGQGRDGQRDQ